MVYLVFSKHFYQLGQIFIAANGQRLKNYLVTLIAAFKSRRIVVGCLVRREAQFKHLQFGSASTNSTKVNLLGWVL